MYQPSGFRGATIWQTLPESTSLENPYWSDPFTRTLSANHDLTSSLQTAPAIEDLSLAQAVELSLIHSREYQGQLESLYLAALNLTFERYRFNIRPLNHLGLEPGSGLSYQQGPDGASQFELGPSFFGLSRLFPSGAQLVGELVNNTIWLAAGSGSSSTASSFALSLVQPLMRGAGREIVLEDLTQAERNVLYAVRDFSRFRRQFFVSTITGGQVAGLQRFLRGFEFLGGSGAPSVGFFPVLLRLQKLRNRQYMTRTLEFLIDDLKAAHAEPLDIARLESTLADSRDELFSNQRIFEDKRDQYKVQLGFPPDMRITLDDSLLKPFQFVDPTLLDLETQLRNLAADLRDPDQSAAEIRTKIRGLAKAMQHSIDIVEQDLVRLGNILPASLEPLAPADAEQLKRIVAEELARFKKSQSEMEQLTIEIESLDHAAPTSFVIDAAPGNPNPSNITSDAEILRRKLLVLLRHVSVESNHHPR